MLQLYNLLLTVVTSVQLASYNGHFRRERYIHFTMTCRIIGELAIVDVETWTISTIPANIFATSSRCCSQLRRFRAQSEIGPWNSLLSRPERKEGCALSAYHASKPRGGGGDTYRRRKSRL